MKNIILGITLFTFIFCSSAFSQEVGAKDELSENLKQYLASDDTETRNSLLIKEIEENPTAILAYVMLLNMYEASAISEGSIGKIDVAINYLQESREYVNVYFKSTDTVTEEPLSEELQEMYPKLREKLKERLKKSIEWEARLKNDGEYLKVMKEGNKLREDGHLRKAIVKYNEAVNVSDNYAHWVYFNRGVAYQRLADYEKALSDLNNSIEISDNDPNAFARRAWIYRDMGNYQKALSDYTTAISMDNEFGNAYLGRSETYHLLGDEEAAKNDLNHAKKIGAFNK